MPFDSAPADPHRPLPLDGVRVVDFTQVMMGPCCTQMLGDYGADVIKIERVGSGDLSRWSVGEDPDGGNNPVFTSLNRNKRSVALDLKSEEDRAAALRLVETADVVVNNFRPGVMERMGFGYEELRRINPRIIYAVGTGFGLEGPYVHKGGQDVLAQAMSGAMHRRADPEIALSVYPTALADYAAGMHMVQGILLALLHREKTGEGQQVAVSLYNSMLAMQMQEAAMWMMRGRELNWAAMPLSGVFETTDGAIVMVGAFKVNPLRDICNALGIDDLSADARYATLEEQKAHRAELQAIFRDRFAGDTTAHWLERLGERRHPVRSGEDAEGRARRPADRLQPDDRGPRPDPRRTGAARRLAHRHVGRAVRGAPRSAEARGAQRGGAGGTRMQQYGGIAGETAPSRTHGMSIEFDVSDGVARVTLNRPERMNAIDSASEAALGGIWDAIDRDPEIRCVVLTGAGRAFCAGADMKEDGPEGIDYWVGTGDHGFGGIAMGGRLSVPVIARVNGAALGGGFEMVLGCDLVVAAESATFGQPEPRVGRLPLDGMVLLPRRIPRAAAMGILLTGRRISAAQALEYGLVNEVVPDEALDAAVDAWVEDVVACAPLSLKAIKRSVQDTAHLTVREARNTRLPSLAAALQSRDADEGVLAFREKRAPVWTGR